MNRPIKFRQARFIDNKIEWHYWGFIGDGFISPQLPDIVHSEGILFQSQQFTGLKDNTKWEQLTAEEQLDWIENKSKNGTNDDWNGKEIYEGDWIKDSKSGSKGVIEWSEKDMGFKIQTETYKGGWSNPIDGFNGYNLEVIGDIYKNPELLKT